MNTPSDLPAARICRSCSGIDADISVMPTTCPTSALTSQAEQSVGALQSAGDSVRS